MRVFEILRNDVKVISEEEIIGRIKQFDWRYEFSENFTRIAKCRFELEVIENMVYRLWKKDADSAVRLWNYNVPQPPEDKTATPSFIYRLQAQDL